MTSQTHQIHRTPRSPSHVEVEQRMWHPDRGRFTWDAPEMRILYRILDWCERRRADVFLQVMWANVDPSQRRPKAVAGLAGD